MQPLATDLQPADHPLNCVQALVKEGGALRVTHVSTKEERRGRPTGLNTVELLKVASSALGLGPHTTMQVRCERRQWHCAYCLWVIVSVGGQLLSAQVAVAWKVCLQTTPVPDAVHGHFAVNRPSGGFFVDSVLLLLVQIAERLYTSGYLSYPRTESSAYPPNFDLQV